MRLSRRSGFRGGADFSVVKVSLGRYTQNTCTQNTRFTKAEQGERVQSTDD